MNNPISVRESESSVALAALAATLEGKQHTIESADIPSACLTGFVTSALSDILLGTDPDLNRHVYYTVPLAIDKVHSEKSPPVHWTWDELVRSAKAPVVKEIEERLREFLLDETPDPFPWSPARHRELDAQALNERKAGNWDFVVETQQEKLLHDGWRRLVGLPSFDRVMNIYHSFRSEVFALEVQALQEVYSRYREERQLPEGWTESQMCPKSGQVGVLLENSEYWLQLLLVNPETRTPQPRCSATWLLVRKDLTKPGPTEAKAILETFIQRAFKVQNARYKKIAWPNAGDSLMFIDTLRSHQLLPRQLWGAELICRREETRSCADGCPKPGQQGRAVGQNPSGLEKWVGRTVKKGFAQNTMPGVNKEWMWVEITRVENGHLVGTLVNDPCLATYLKYGDQVILTEDEIFAVLP